VDRNVDLVDRGEAPGDVTRQETRQAGRHRGADDQGPIAGGQVGVEQGGGIVEGIAGGHHVEILSEQTRHLRGVLATVGENDHVTG
jgi:hypothetical protein